MGVKTVTVASSYTQIMLLVPVETLQNVSTCTSIIGISTEIMHYICTQASV